MLLNLSILAQVSAESTHVPGSAEIVLVGFVFVILVLALLAGVTAAIGALFARKAANSARRAQIAAEKAAAQKETSSEQSRTTGSTAVNETAEEGEDPLLPIVIAAAVHSMMRDRPHRVVSIRSSGAGWAQEGRRQIFSSHRVR